MLHIVIFADEPDWHCRRLGVAFTRLGLSVSFQSLTRCAFSLGASGPGIAIPGCGERLPDAAIIRAIPKGSFEQVTFCLSLLHALSALGILVINDARAIERCVDKGMTSFLLHRAGIPIPRTLVSEEGDAINSWRRQTNQDTILKPLFGAQGRGLARLSPSADLPLPETYEGVYYAQHYVGREAEWHDFRVFVVGEEPVAAMMRHGKSWITNVCRGAECEGVPCSGRLAELAQAAARAVGAQYCGVDLIDDEDGVLQVLEVNSMPAWGGLQRVTKFSIAERIAAHVVAAL
jgi:tetrahydromethanopterin:alpha-L-glutamate ligase